MSSTHSMIDVKSCLRTPDGAFHDIHEATAYQGDRDYVEGAIELTVNHVPIIDRDMYDYVDQLWACLVRVLEEVAESGRGETLFPDQPIRLVVERQGRDGVLVSCDPGDGRRTAYATEAELTAAVAEGAAVFFRRMAELIPANSGRYEFELAKIAALKAG
ncbi:hypothetical protein [Streptomyces sp. KR55]|uniref:hypothetical protein n=1 Tax=Streptomyces sp. KR55 TaxID=3457425 RepID=UPI003FD20B36